MLDALINSKAAASFMGSFGEALGGGAGPAVSSAQADARSFFDGSGWTVSTGSGRATGGTSGGGMRAPGGTGGAAAPGWEPAPGGAMQAGGGWLTLAMVGGLVWFIARN